MSGCWGWVNRDEPDRLGADPESAAGSGLSGDELQSEDWADRTQRAADEAVVREIVERANARRESEDNRRAAGL